MARKRGNTPETDGGQMESDPSTTTTATTAPAPATGDGPQLAPRLSVQLDDQGRIAWARMRPDTRDKLKAALTGDNVLPFTPGPAPATTARADSFPPQLAEVLYDSLSMFFVGLARRGGHTPEQASTLAFSAQEKGVLIPPTIAVLNKYNASLGQYQEEIILGTLLTTIITGKLALLRKPAEILPFPAHDTGAGGSQEGN